MKYKISVIGLGYVGLPLAYELSKYFDVVGFDIDKTRVEQLSNNIDKNTQISKLNLKKSNFVITSNSKFIKDSNVYVVTVPTPIKKNKKPDLSPLIKSSKLISKCVNKKDTIIYESTMYPGLTDEVLIPLIEKISKLKINKDFYVGYSPERISPGEPLKSLTNIKKVISGSSPRSIQILKNIYKKIIKAGIYIAPNIKTAEASKILENMQRDLNISLINEASIIFDKLNINTYEVISAAQTKWNFIKLTPGLVGGHCISVDPYYMKFKAEKLGYKPAVISSGRKINENMALYIAKKIMIFFRDKKQSKFQLGIMGLTFKENCSDTRNSQVFKIIDFFKNKNIDVEILDPWVNKQQIKNNNIKQRIVEKFTKKLDCLLIAVAHKKFTKLKKNFYVHNMKRNSLIFDVKNILKNNSFKNIEKLTL